MKFLISNVTYILWSVSREQEKTLICMKHFQQNSCPVRKENTDYKYMNDKPKGILFVISSRPTDWVWCEQNSTDTQRQAGYHPNHSCLFNHLFCTFVMMGSTLTFTYLVFEVTSFVMFSVSCTLHVLSCVHLQQQSVSVYCTVRFMIRQQTTEPCHCTCGRFAHSKFTSFNSDFVVSNMHVNDCIDLAFTLNLDA